MKLFYILMFTLLSTTQWSNAQSMVTVTNASAPVACDGSALFNQWSSYDTDEFTWSWYQDSTLINTGDTSITNLCPGGYQFLLQDTNEIIISTIWFIIGDPCSNFYVTATSTNTEPNACTGTISMNPIGGSAPYAYTWSNGTTTQNLTNLCPGTYSITCVDANGCTANTAATVMEEGDSTGYLNANISIIDDNDGNCTGSASIDPIGGIAPYSSVWSNGSTTNSASGLCAGIYSVTVWDAAGDTTYNTFVVNDPSSTYGNNPYTDSIPVDVLYGDLIENCTIDYSEIDSASLSNAIYDSVSQNLYVTWVIYSANGTTTYLYDTLGLTGASGVYNVSITVFCPAKSIDEYFKIVGGIYLNTDGTLSIEENDILLSAPYPNPFTGTMAIQNGQALECNITLVDATGRIVLNEQSNAELIQLNNLSSLNTGAYYLHVITDKGSKTWKLVK